MTSSGRGLPTLKFFDLSFYWKAGYNTSLLRV